MAILNGTISDQTYPDGADLSAGVLLRLRTDAPSLAVIFRHVNGNLSHQSLDDLAEEDATDVRLLPDAESGNVRKILFLVNAEGTVGSLTLESAVEASTDPPSEDTGATQDTTATDDPPEDTSQQDIATPNSDAGKP